MIFRFVFFAAVIAAQGFAESEVDDEVLLTGANDCKFPAVAVPYKLGQALMKMDEVREIVSSAATDAYARSTNVGLIISCFSDEISNYIDLGEQLSIMITNSSTALAHILKNKAAKYEKLLEEPLFTISQTLKELPGKVVKYITHMQFIKAFRAVREARRIINANAIRVGVIVQNMSQEIPELADKVRFVINEIFKTASKRSEDIKKIFYECILEHK